MQIQEIQCRSILTRTGGYLRPVCSHSLNPYIGCGYGRTLCGAGCYVRANGWLTRGRDWGGFLEVKINAPEIYRSTVAAERRWARRRGGPFSVFLSSSTEPWQPAERRYRVTRRLLDAMNADPPDALILQTHAALILEDRERIVSLLDRARVRVHVSIETDRDRLPGLPAPPCPVRRRIEVVRALSRAGVPVVVCVAPLLPIARPEAFFASLAEAGARAVVIDHFIGGDGTAEGSRTRRTRLPQAMERVLPESLQLSYRDRMAAVAGRYLPVGLSAAGFSGEYRTLT